MIKNHREGGETTNILLNPTKYGTVLTELEGDKQFTSVNTKAGISFPGVMLHTEHGSIPVVSDRNCPVNRGFALDISTWAMLSMGPAPDFLNTEANAKGIFQVTDDAVQAALTGVSALAGG